MSSTIKRPDLSQLDHEVVAYIEALEAELEQLRDKKSSAPPSPREATFEQSEPPTTLNVVTLSQQGFIKRTARHHYLRQRRGGMGIFDMEVTGDDAPALLTVVNESHALLLVTNQARAFKVPTRQITETPIRSKGQNLLTTLPLRDDESAALLMPLQESGYLTIVTKQGEVRRIRHSFLGYNMEPGYLLFDYRSLGAPAAACWSKNDKELFIATRNGRAIRFAEQLISYKGGLGIRLSDGDEVVGVTVVTEESGVFLLSEDGKGIIRQMSGFAPNKAPGSGGKNAMKTNRLIGATTTEAGDDLFITSQLGKIIRFNADEVSTTEGVVQGVHCMGLRADEPTALIATNVS
ncbi:MAG: DNA gyrase C-terminal beta-propeller domain-containing protein [Chloroflexota bacterium]